MDNFERAKENFLEGIALLEGKNFQEAEFKFKESLRLYPDRVSTLTNLSATQIKLKKYSDAKISALQAITFDSNNYEAFLNLGLAENGINNPITAIEYFNKALFIHPDQVDGWLNKGASLNELERYDEALACYGKAIELNPRYSEAWHNQGITLNELKRYDEALACYEKALELNPGYCEAWSNRGVTLGEQNLFDEALASYELAIELNGSYSEAWSSKGYTLAALNRLDEALACYEKALALKPDDINARFNQSLSYLILGDFRSGWIGYQNRWERKKSEVYRHENIPKLINIQNINEKRILVWSEQGYGDTIQFCRFITDLLSIGANVTFEVQSPLKNLMSRSFPGCHVICENDKVLNIDYQVPLLDLPLLFDTTLKTIPKNIPYLIASKEKNIEWGNQLKKKSRLNIGIAISGNEAHKNDRNRSIAIEFFEPLLEIGNLFLIQKSIKESDKKFLANKSNIIFLGDQIHSFDDSAAIAQQMDFIVSVDTSLAHLAGALGLPTYLLLPWNPEWRWLLDRRDSPWYPTISILRQPSMGDWHSSISQLISEIGRLNPPKSVIH